MPNANPAWFDVDYFAAQKILQMQVLGQEVPAGDTPTAQLNTAIAEYNAENNANVTPFTNFEACNTSDYIADIPMSAVNVSPNPMFDVAYYLTAVAANANAKGYTADGYPAGEWTADSVLEHMFNDFHISAWDHFKAGGLDDMINPSADFNTAAYIAAKAEATGVTETEVIDQMKADGLNPVQDYFENGQEYITAAELKVADPLTPGMNEGGQWGDMPVPPEDVDPFEQNVHNVPVTPGQQAYPGEGETYTGNTQFDAAWLPNSASSTLNAKDTFEGPANQFNTLSVNLGKNWNGFNGVKQDDGSLAPSVTNVGRIKLSHSTANNEASWTFDAKNIAADASRYDLVGADGPGSISLKNLAEGVNDIRISSLTPKDLSGGKTGLAPDATAINFATGANSGKNDALTLTVENVGASGKAAEITSTSFGIENLTVKAMKGDDQSYVDLSDLTGVKSLAFTGDGNIQVTDVATSVKSFDASAATGSVNMAVSSTSSSTSVKGGAGYDTVTLTSNTTWTPAAMENIEALAVMNGGNINFAKIESAPATLNVWGGNTTIRNLSASDYTVNQYDNAKVTVNGTRDGSLGNLTYNTPGNETGALPITAGDVESNATGDVVFNINGKDTYKGAITLGKAQSLTINANEEADSKFYATTLTANAITALTVNASNAVTIDTASSSLKALQDVTLNLETTTSIPDSTAINVDMPAAQNVTVNAGGEDVTLQALGSEKGSGSVTLDVNEASKFTVGDIKASLGANINVDIEATGNVTIGNFTNSTTVLAGGEGDIHLTVASDGGNVVAAAGITINGGPMTIDLGEVTGDAFATSKEATLESSGDITYTGAAGDDNIILGLLGKGSTANIDLGSSGANGNKLTIQDLENDGTVNVNVTFGDGKDTLTVDAQTGGNVLITVSDASLAHSDSVNVKALTGNMTESTINTALASVGLAPIDTATVADAATNHGIFTYEGNTYFTAGPSTVVVVEGVEDTNLIDAV